MNRAAAERNVVVALALGRTAWCAWRAATQSLVHDEAQTFNNFLTGWGDAYFKFHSNNHVLFSLLAKLSITLFGVSEFALRLPTVIAGFFLMLGFWRVLEHIPSRVTRWIAFGVLAVNPPFLDFSVAARGYGLSLALLVWALDAAMRVRPAIAGILLGLSISANFTAGLPAAGVIAAAALLTEGSLSVRLRSFATMAGAATLVLAVVCGGALAHFDRGELYAGAPTLHDSLYNLIVTSLHATPRLGLVEPWRASNHVLDFALPVIGVFIAIRACLAWRAGDRRTPLAPLALTLALLAMMTAHRFLGMPYPVDRTGLTWILLFAIAWAGAAGVTANPLLRGANLLIGLLLAAQFVTQAHGDYLTVWWYDRSTKEVARRIESQTLGRPPGSVSISATWINQPALEFYRVRDRVASWKSVERHDPTLFTGYDYYVLNSTDANSPAAHAFTALFSDPFAGVLLAQ